MNNWPTLRPSLARQITSLKSDAILITFNRLPNLAFFSAEIGIVSVVMKRSTGREISLSTAPGESTGWIKQMVIDKNPDIKNLLLDDYFKEQVDAAQVAWRRVVARAVEMGIPVPAMSSALAFYDGYRRERLPANLLQAQRDYFGAHTYERVDRPRGEFFHTNWTGHGGTTAASTYNV